MRLSNKVLLFLGVTWIIFLIASYAGAHEYLIKGFLKLEHEEIKRNISRANQSINQILYSLGTFTVDYAHWNDAYLYVVGQNPQFIPNNMDINALLNSNINLLMYLNKKGDILWAAFADLDKIKWVGFPKGIEKYIYPGGKLEKQVTLNENVKGLLLTDSGIMMIASAGISYSDLSKPINGYIIAGRSFSDKLLKKISDATSLDLILYTPQQIEKNTQIKEIYDSTLKNSTHNEVTVLIKDNKNVYGYFILKDINDQPIGMIQLKNARTIFLTGETTINYYLAFFLLTGLLLGIIIWILLRMLILNRLEYLNKEIGNINNQQDYAKRIIMKENDELSSVAKQFNEMMQTIQNSYKQLEQQIQQLSRSESRLAHTNVKLTTEISERKQAEEKVALLHNKLVLSARRAGMADIASGILHNVGNVLNSVTTSLALAKERNEQSKVDKLSKIADHLKSNENHLTEFLKDHENNKKILHYLLIISQSWREDNHFISQELARLEKNIGHIKSAITMQQSLTTMIGMIEEVNIPELIEDALILHKTLYENNKIKIIRHFSFREKVMIDRVKLLQVIVNVIKNSIDSLIESKKDLKQLNIYINKLEDDEEYFEIKIEDNGIGILPENMDKIFTSGFTTKPTGHGLGLHTSAIFVEDMHGQILVESEGKNLGASFSIVLPIHPISNDDNINEEMS